MFYRPGQDEHGLPRNPFNALITPRPIAWVSTRAADGTTNLAPFSFFNGAAYEPPIVSIAFTGAKLGAHKGERKDTLANIRETKDFAVNIVPSALKDAMNASAGHFGIGESEFAAAGVTEAPCETITAPRVAESPACFECRLVRLVELPNEGPGENVTVFGRVLGVHISESILTDGFVDPTKFHPLARMGYLDYATITEVFAMSRPD
ncbi:MAG: flavin reductase family protein [Pikeienuella sp.]|uniref:flavin reductase family protein n=1 Tax=Pikeienuella sp. TaxID=2831957 RepID=UPI00391BFDBB